MTDDEPRRVHLLLGAGGVRCLSYIGALEQLEREGYKVATVSTCSAGTLVGALYCAGVTPSKMREATLELDLRELAGGGRLPGFLRLPGLLKRPPALYAEPGTAQVFKKLLKRQGFDPDPTLESLCPPLSTAAVDVAARRLLVYSSDTNPDMPVSVLLRIATAVPVVYGPYRRDGRQILDASVASYAPIWLATGQREDLPIVVLRTQEKNRREERNPRRGRALPGWINEVLASAVASRDTFLLERLPRVSVYDIPVEISAFDFGLSRAEVESLIEAGRDVVAGAAERQREGLSSRPAGGDQDGRAEMNTTTLYGRHLERVARSRAATIFLSYAREDRRWVERLREPLRRLVADPDVSVWDDSYIKPSGLWRPAIEDAIRRASVAVFFVSRSFEASHFIAGTELPLLREHVPPERRFSVSVDGTMPSGAEAEIQMVADAKALEGEGMSETDADDVLVELARLVEEAYRSAGDPRATV